MTITKSAKVFLREHPGIVAALVCAAVLIAMFCVLASKVSGKGLFSFDEPLLLFLHAHASPFLDVFFKTITHLGDTVVIIGLAIALGMYYAYKKSYQKAILFVVGIGGVVVLNTVLKSLFQRDRPLLWERIVDETNFSFPSGHAMLSAAFATMIIVLFWNTKYRWLAIVVSAVATVVVGLSRLYLGVHYPSDVLAGWCVSASWILLLWIGILRFTRKAPGLPL